MWQHIIVIVSSIWSRASTSSILCSSVDWSKLSPLTPTALIFYYFIHFFLNSWRENKNAHHLVGWLVVVIVVWYIITPITLHNINRKSQRSAALAPWSAFAAIIVRTTKMRISHQKYECSRGGSSHDRFNCKPYRKFCRALALQQAGDWQMPRIGLAGMATAWCLQQLQQQQPRPPILLLTFKCI